jgi:hypothetical protein
VSENTQEPVPAASSEAESSNRGGFLRRAGTFALVGLGVALVPSKAKAAGGHCCKDTSCGPCTNSIPYKCYDFCLRQYCCVCTEFHSSTCFDTGCPC